MRKMALILLSACLIACEAGTPQTAATIEEGQWRDANGGGLCVGKDGSAAFILYGENGANCMAQGRVVKDDDGLAFTPRGDQACRIPIARDGDNLRFGDGGAACSYYCGGGTELTGRTARRNEATADPLKDGAGDPIC